MSVRVRVRARARVPKRAAVPERRSRTPLKASPDPIGQRTGHVAIPNSASISSHSSYLPRVTSRGRGVRGGLDLVAQLVPATFHIQMGWDGTGRDERRICWP
jgi:hypothetical protein